MTTPCGAGVLPVTLPAQEFSIGVTRAPGRAVVTVRGELDAATAPRLRDAVDELVDHGRDRDVVIDMEGLTFIDSSGIYVLIQARKLVRSGGWELTLSGISPGAYKVLDICGHTSVFDLGRPPGRPERSAARGVSGRWR